MANKRNFLLIWIKQAFNAFSTQIQNQFDHLMASQSKLNHKHDKLRTMQWH